MLRVANHMYLPSNTFRYLSIGAENHSKLFSPSSSFNCIDLFKFLWTKVLLITLSDHLYSSPKSLVLEFCQELCFVNLRISSCSLRLLIPTTLLVLFLLNMRNIRNFFFLRTIHWFSSNPIIRLYLLWICIILT